ALSRACSPVDPSPSGVSVLERVPELDRGLADPPAEEHFLPVAERGEVEQAGVGILQLHADQRQLVHDLLQLARQLRELRRAGVADPFAAAVPCNDADDLALLVLELREPGAQLYHPFRERAYLSECAVSLVGREPAVGHHSKSSMRRRLAAWICFVAFVSFIAYVSRFPQGKPDPNLLYQWSAPAGELIVFAIIIGATLAITAGRYELLALRQPSSWGRALGLCVVLLVVVYALTSAIDPI